MSQLSRYLIVNDHNCILHAVIHPHSLIPIIVWDRNISTAMWFANENEATKYINRHHIKRCRQVVDKNQIEMKLNDYELLTDELSNEEDN